MPQKRTKGDRLAPVLKARRPKWNWKRLVRESGVSLKTIYNVRFGGHAPSGSVIAALAFALKMKAAELREALGL